MSRALSASSRIVFLQTGDYRETARHFAAGGTETFHAQRYSMEIVERLAKTAAWVGVICVSAAEAYTERLPSAVETIGLTSIWREPDPCRPVLAQLATIRPTHVVHRFPAAGIVRWCLDHDVHVLPSFADSFTPRAGLRKWIDRRRFATLRRTLNDARISVVANHNIAASESLALIGVDPGKIVPWDWPRSPRPEDFAPKRLDSAPHGRPRRLICVGTVTEAKGVGDAIRALACDPRLRREAELEVIGDGEIANMRALAAGLGVEDRVHFAGRIPHADVTPRMRAADLVLVCSRHAYAEGLPGTLYLGLASRTPLVITDHPMFAHYFEDGVDVRMVPERNPERLAAGIKDVLDRTDLYNALSANAEAAFARIEHPVLWADVVERWLRDEPEDRAWLSGNTLPSWRGKRTPELPGLARCE